MTGCRAGQGDVDAVTRDHRQRERRSMGGGVGQDKAPDAAPIVSTPLASTGFRRGKPINLLAIQGGGHAVVNGTATNFAGPGYAMLEGVTTAPDTALPALALVVVAPWMPVSMVNAPAIPFEVEAELEPALPLPMVIEPA